MNVVNAGIGYGLHMHIKSNAEQDTSNSVLKTLGRTTLSEQNESK